MSEYHGWTHRPKSEGGTDPIPGFAFARVAYTNTHTIASSLGSYTVIGGATPVNNSESVDSGDLTAQADGIHASKAGVYLVSGWSLWDDINWTDKRRTVLRFGGGTYLGTA